MSSVNMEVVDKISSDSDELIQISKYDIVQEFSELSKMSELTNVFQLRVNKAKHHLTNLAESIRQKMIINNCINIDKLAETDIIELDNISIKDKLMEVEDQFASTNYLNEGSITPISNLLNDTCVLISRLETDRCFVDLEINKQQTKVKDLLRKIGSISFFRMDMLPSAVQKEHEACANDISELQWHIKHRRQIEKKLRQKRNKAAEINENLKEEIESIKEHIPLVEEKLELEESMMKKIQETKDKLIQDSEISAERQRITKEKHDEANKKTESERQHIKRDLNKANKTLLNVQKALQHGEKEYGKLLDFRARSQEKIIENNLQITKLISDNESKEKEQTLLEEAMDKLERKDRELQFDNKRLTNTRNEKQKELRDQESKHEEQRSFITNSRQELEQKLITVKRSNKQLEKEIEKMKESQEKSLSNTEKMQHSIESTKDEIKESEERYETTVEEFSSVSRDHAAVQQRLADENRRVQEIENNLRKSLSEIEQGIKQEILTKSNFKTKIVTDSQDLDVSKKGALEKEKKMQKDLKEALAIVKETKLKVAEIESQHNISKADLKKLQLEYKTITEKREMIKKEKNGLIDQLMPIHDELKDKLDQLVQKQELVDWQIQTMNSELMEMSRSEILITKSKKKLQESLLDINNNNNVVIVDLDICRKTIVRLEETINHLTTQSNRLRITHDKYLQDRNNVLINLEKELEEVLNDNKVLAAQYRTSQTDYYSMEDSFLDVMQEQLWGEENVKNIKEVQRLQKYMHNNLDIFFSVKVMYDDDQFRDLQKESGRSEERVKELRLKYSFYIEQMRQFLRDNFINTSEISNDQCG